MVEAQGAGLGVELEHGAQGDVGTVALAGCRCASLVGVSGDIGRSVYDSDVDMAGNVVDLVDPLVSRSLRARGQQEGKVGTGRHGDHADPLGVEAALRRLAAYHPDSPLPVFPCCLVEGEAFLARSPVDEVDALHAGFREFLVPEVYKVHVAGRVVTSSRDQDHAGAVADIFSRCLEPLQVGGTVFLGVETLGRSLVEHGRYLLVALVRHLPFRPDVLANLRT